MKKLIFLSLMLICAFTVSAQSNYSSPGIPSGTTTFTPTFRYKPATPDSIAKIWLGIGGNKFYRMSTGMDDIVFSAINFKGAGTTSSKIDLNDNVIIPGTVTAKSGMLIGGVTDTAGYSFSENRLINGVLVRERFGSTKFQGGGAVMATFYGTSQSHALAVPALMSTPFFSSDSSSTWHRIPVIDNYIGATLDTVTHTLTVTGSGSDSTLYKKNGTLVGDRTVTQGDKELFFTAKSGTDSLNINFSPINGFSTYHEDGTGLSAFLSSIAGSNSFGSDDAVSRSNFYNTSAGDHSITTMQVFDKITSHVKNIQMSSPVSGYAKGVLVNDAIDSVGLVAGSSVDTAKMTGKVYVTAEKVAGMIGGGGSHNIYNTSDSLTSPRQLKSHDYPLDFIFGDSTQVSHSTEVFFNKDRFFTAVIGNPTASQSAVQIDQDTTGVLINSFLGASSSGGTVQQYMLNVGEDHTGSGYFHNSSYFAREYTGGSAQGLYFIPTRLTPIIADTKQHRGLTADSLTIRPLLLQAWDYVPKKYVDSVAAASGTTTHPLTLSYGLTGTLFNGSTAVTATLDTAYTNALYKNFFASGTFTGLGTPILPYALNVSTSPTSGSSLPLTSDAAFTALAGKQSTLTAGAGLTLTGAVISVNTSQNISTLSNLTSNGLVKTSGGTGALSIATAGTDYQSPITLTTTNSSGAATFIGNTLNIPNYSGGAVSSVSNSDGTLTISPTTGAVVSSLNLGHSNAFTARQTITAAGTSNSQFAAGSFEVQSYAVNNAWLGENAYYDGSGFKYRANGGAELLYFQSGSLQVRLAASGTAGGSASLAQAQLSVLTDGSFSTGNSAGTKNFQIIGSNGHIIAGSGADNGTDLLQVPGGIYATSMHNQANSILSLGNNSNSSTVISDVDVGNGSTSTHASGVYSTLSIYPNINESSTAGYRGLWISAYEQATGSGNKNLIDVGTNTAASGGGTYTSKFAVTDAGVINSQSLTASKVVFTDALKNLTSTGIGTSSQYILGDGSLGTIGAKPHTIFTPATGGTVTLTTNQYNIINPSGTLATLTVTLPSSPANNDCVFIKYTQAVTAVTYSGGTVVDGITAPTAGGLVVLTYDSGTTSWY